MISVDGYRHGQAHFSIFTVGLPFTTTLYMKRRRVEVGKEG